VESLLISHSIEGYYLWSKNTVFRDGSTAVSIIGVSWDFVPCGPKRDGVTGEWRKLYYEELHNLYSSPSIIRIIKSRRMRWAGHVARMGEKKNVYKLLVGKPEGKRPLGRPRRR
jgi:hypothetical protein